MRARRLESASTSRQRMNRRSFLNASMGSVLAVNSITAGVIGALLQPKNREESKNIPELDHYSFHRLVESALGDVSFQVGYSRTFSPEEHSDIAPVQMASAAMERLGEENIIEVVCSAYEWASNYQISYEEASRIQGATFDCNDPARHVCEKLSQPGIPMYFLSIWPKQPRDRLFHDWHQMAVCKLDDRYFFVVDNAKEGIYWHGSLQEFVTELSAEQSVPRSIIPGVGIAEFVEPRYDVAPAKFLLQFAHMRNEGEMKSLGIHPQMPPNTQLAKNMK